MGLGIGHYKQTVLLMEQLVILSAILLQVINFIISLFEVSVMAKNLVKEDSFLLSYSDLTILIQIAFLLEFQQLRGWVFLKHHENRIIEALLMVHKEPRHSIRSQTIRKLDRELSLINLYRELK